MALLELKQEIEKRTAYTFTVKESVLGDKVLLLDGLPKKREIGVRLGQSFFASVGGTDTLKSDKNPCGYRGFGCPCNNIDEIISRLDCMAKEYGYKIEQKQISLF